MPTDARPFRRLKAVILDWAGSAVDFGSRAPVEAFAAAFREFGVELDEETIRGPMGLPKREHAARLLSAPEVRQRWRLARGEEPGEAALDAVFERIEAAMAAAASALSIPIPGLLEFVAAARAGGLRIGATTGYTETIMEGVAAAAAKAGYKPDASVCPGPRLPGRPAPWMLLEVARRLDAYPASSVVKIGDTPADIGEGRAAGAWTIGLSLSGNECGLSEKAYGALDEERRVETRARASARLRDADFIVDGIWDCLPALRAIDALLECGVGPETWNRLTREERARATAEIERDAAAARSLGLPISFVPDNPYLLLTPGPLSTSKGVRAVLLKDHCTWDREYNDLVQELRGRLLGLALPLGGAHEAAATGGTARGWSVVPMQGSGSFAVEAAVGSLVPEGGKLLVLENGAYGKRMAETARRAGIEVETISWSERLPVDPDALDAALARDPSITHVGAVHVETTTGILNPAEAIAQVARSRGRALILDAMSSFGGIPTDLEDLRPEALVSSANKCLQGIPGFGFVIARTEALERAKERSRSLCLDLHDQWRGFEEGRGKWRFTSPTHAVRALLRALEELEEEGGVGARHARFVANRDTLVAEFLCAGLEPLLAEPLRSPIITSFIYPEDRRWDFGRFYEELKSRGFVLYPGKISDAQTFRVGSIGHVFPGDFRALGASVRLTLQGMGLGGLAAR